MNSSKVFKINIINIIVHLYLHYMKFLTCRLELRRILLAHHSFEIKKTFKIEIYQSEPQNLRHNKINRKKSHYFRDYLGPLCHFSLHVKFQHDNAWWLWWFLLYIGNEYELCIRSSALQLL